MDELKIFQNKAFGAVRVVEHNGEPWFVAKDIARALDYAEQSNPARLFRSVPEEWKGVKQIHTPGGEQDMLIISEQGLYFFLGRSDKEAALITVHLSPEDDGIQYETTDFAITGPGQLGLLAFFMDKYGISRQLSLLDGRRSSGARTVPAPKGGMPQ